MENKTKEAKKGDGKDGNKKHKKENGNGNQIKNLGQPDEFKVAKGKIWKENFLTLLPQDQQVWNDNVKMCAHWHIKGNAFCREEAKKNKKKD